MNKEFPQKILSTLIKIPLQVLIALIMPRILTKESYGFYDYYYNIISKFTSIIDGGSGNALFVHYSKNKNNQIINYYLRYLTIIYVVFFFLISTIGYLIIDESYKIILILLIFTHVFNLLVLRAMSNVQDALGNIWFNEKQKIIQLILNLTYLIVVYSFFENYNLLLILIGFFCINLITIARYNIAYFFRISLDKSSKDEFRIYFIKYVKPLLIYLILSNLIIIVGRFLLNIYGDFEDQAEYGISLKITSVATILLTSIIPLVTRDISVINKIENSGIYLRNIFVINLGIGLLTFTCFYLFSDYFVLLFGGYNYKDAGSILKLLGLMPLLTIINQIFGSYYYGNELTRIYAKRAILSSIFGLLVTIISMKLLSYEFFSFRASIILALSIIFSQFIRALILSIDLWNALNFRVLDLFLVILCGIIIVISSLNESPIYLKVIEFILFVIVILGYFKLNKIKIDKLR